MIIAGEVFGAGRDTGALNPANSRACHKSGKKRILGVVFKIPAAERIAVDIHARGEQHVGAEALHFFAYACIKPLNEFGIPRACKPGADRQQRRTGGETDTRRAVGRDRGGNTLVTKRSKHTAECAGIALSAEGAVHYVVSPAYRLKLIKAELGDKIAHGSLAAFDVGEFNSLVARLRNGGGQIIENRLLY